MAIFYANATESTVMKLGMSIAKYGRFLKLFNHVYKYDFVLYLNFKIKR